MTYPLFPNKHKLNSKMNKEDRVNLHPSFSKKGFQMPVGVILTYQEGVIEYVKANYESKTRHHFFGDLTYLHSTNDRVAIASGFGCGAPLSSMVLESLISLGIKKFISLGSAGGLQNDQKFGDVILANRALRDEGTSYHYLPPSKYSYPSKSIASSFENTLKSRHVDFIRGDVWTTDAPYRETEEEIAHYNRKGVLAVDMETSALYAVAQYRAANIISAFSISDSLLDKRIVYNLEEAKKGLEKIADSAIDCLGAISH